MAKGPRLLAFVCIMALASVMSVDGKTGPFEHKDHDAESSSAPADDLKEIDATSHNETVSPHPVETSDLDQNDKKSPEPNSMIVSSNLVETSDLEQNDKKSLGPNSMIVISNLVETSNLEQNDKKSLGPNSMIVGSNLVESSDLEQNDKTSLETLMVVRDLSTPGYLQPSFQEISRQTSAMKTPPLTAKTFDSLKKSSYRNSDSLFYLTAQTANVIMSSAALASETEEFLLQARAIETAVSLTISQTLSSVNNSDTKTSMKSSALTPSMTCTRGKEQMTAFDLTSMFSTNPWTGDASSKIGPISSDANVMREKSAYKDDLVDACRHNFEHAFRMTGDEDNVSLFAQCHAANSDCVCTFNITAPSNQYLSVEFDEFAFPCKNGSHIAVKFKDSYSVLGRFCDKKPPKVFSSTNSLVFQFSKPQKGLQVVARCALMSAKPELELLFTTSDSGYVTSPWYDGSETCLMTTGGLALVLPTPREKLLLVSFEDLRLGSGNCIQLSSAGETDNGGQTQSRVAEVFQHCGNDVAPAKFFSTSVNIFFNQSRECRTHGFKLKFSFQSNTDAASVLPKPGQFNCSTPVYSRFRQHVDCNLMIECDDARDEVNCSYSSPGCGSGFHVKGSCYQLRVKSKNITWSRAFHKCSTLELEQELATATSLSELKSVARVLQSHNKWLLAYIGLKTSDSGLPPQYKRMLQWMDGRVTYDLNMTDGQVIPSCVGVDVGSDVVFRWVRCENEIANAFICKRKSDVKLTDTTLSNYPYISELDSEEAFEILQQNISTVHCPDGKVLLDVVSCCPSEQCGKEFPTTECNTRTGGSMPTFLCDDQFFSVAYTFVCDKFKDCVDGSDETFCLFRICSMHEFQCASSGECISRRKRCDGVADCSDNSDEESCGDMVSSTSGEIQALPESSLIDRNVAGSLRYQEWNASLPCPATHFRCPGSHCLPVYLLCNEVKDCPRGEDETDCETYTCPGYFKCKRSLVCLHPQYVCDGILQCPRHDDELYCNVKCPENCRCQGNALVCSEPITSRPLTQLRFLDAAGSGMRLSDFSSNFLLVYLSLKDCRLVELDDSVDLENLRELDLSNNLLPSVNMKTFKRFRNLRVLKLSYNPFSAPFELSVEDFPIKDNLALVEVHLAGLHQSTFSADGLSKYRNIKLLNVSDGDFETVSSFQHLRHLESLDMTGSPVKTFPRDVFKDLTNLKEIYTDNYKLCCPAVLPKNVLAANCHAPQDEISSCDNLLELGLYRVFLWTFSSVAILGNGATFAFRMFFREKSSNTGFSTLVTSLSLSDFLMGVYLAMIGAADQMYQGTYQWNDEEWKQSCPCRMAGFLALLFSEVSALTICLITLDRFIALRFPFSTRHFSRRSALLACGIVWVMCAVLAAVPLLPFTKHWNFYSQTGICLPLPVTRNDFPGQSFSFGIMIILNFVLFLFVALGQAAIFWSVRANTAAVASQDKKRRSRDSIVAKRLASVVLSDFLCWFPIGLLGILSKVGVAVPGGVNVAVAIFVLPFNSALNPFLYTLNAVMERRRQKALLKMSLALEMKIRSEMTGRKPGASQTLATDAVRSSYDKHTLKQTDAFQCVIAAIERAPLTRKELDEICRVVADRRQTLEQAE